MLSHQPVGFLDFVGHLPALQCWQGESNGGSEIRVEWSPRAIFHLLKGRNLPSPLSLPGPGLPDPDLPGPRFTQRWICLALRGGGWQKGRGPNLPDPKRRGWQKGGLPELTRPWTYPALDLPGPKREG